MADRRASGGIAKADDVCDGSAALRPIKQPNDAQAAARTNQDARVFSARGERALRLRELPQCKGDDIKPLVCRSAAAAGDISRN
mmetsp:Transcript_116646/g.329933  ORF Transcript_116646/g.329933 Transcript_116646/m.329933 type:complete len:84 (+) Transcript_116646:485-736(+)